MTNTITEIKSLIGEISQSYDSHWIAFSGGLDSSILAQSKKSQNISGITIITKDFFGTDLTYSQIAAKHIGIPLDLNYIETDHILNAIEKTIEILKNFNDIEIRNSIVPYLYLSELKEKKVTKIITGDGADEIFAGYNFIIKKSHTEIENELNRMKHIMHFPSQKIASELGMSVEMPFINEKIIKFAEKLPTNLLVNHKDNTTFGNWILRKAFENDLPNSIIWREKTPMQDGSGTTGLTKLFESIITDDIFKEKTKKIKNDDGINIRTKESLHYYEIFRKKSKVSKSGTGLNLCTDCNSEIIPETRFCRMCGKFPLT